MKLIGFLLMVTLGAVSFAQSGSDPIDGEAIRGQVDLIPVSQEGVNFYRLNIKGDAAQELKALAKKAAVSGSKTKIWSTESYFCFEEEDQELTCNLFVKKNGKMVQYQAEALVK